MKIKQAWEVTDYFTSKTSLLTQVFGALMLILGVSASKHIYIAFGAFIVLANILQYAVHGWLWHAYTRHMEKKGIKTFRIPVWLNYAGWILFDVKVLATIMTAIYLMGVK